MGPSIKLDAVSLVLAGNQILAPLSAELESGKLHLLIGPNGAGKTSLLKTLLGLMPHQGQIDRVWADKAQTPAYIPQQPKFDAVLPVTIEDYLMAIVSPRPLFFRQSQKACQQVKDLLARVGMADKSQLQLGQLSGGERQRLMFAQALHRESSLWFMDEPMTGLDDAGQALITDLINELRQQQCTLVMVHHDMDFVRQYADNVLLIDSGLRMAGTPQQVLGEDSLDATVRRLVAEVA